MPRTSARQGTLPFTRRTPGRAVPVPESVIEAQTDYHLHADGARVLSTVHRYKKQCCSRCGNVFYPKGGYGATPGVPDRLARLSHWAKGLWLGLELKGSKTVLSPEQKILRDEGAIYVCRSADEARDALEEADEFFRRFDNRNHK